MHKVVSQIEAQLTLCGDSVEFNGTTYVPSSSLAFLTFEVAHSFPAYTTASQAIMPEVLARSFKSLTLTPLDFEHAIAAYHPSQPAMQDRIIGTVVAVQLVTPGNRIKVYADKSKAPFVRGIASVFKVANGAAVAFGRHISGDKKLSVSMEVSWALEDSAFAIALGPGVARVLSDTPPDALAAGWEIIPYAKADRYLRGTYSAKASCVTGFYQGRKTIMLMGGMDSAVEFLGLGVVGNPASREAKITRVWTGTDTDKELKSVASAIKPQPFSASSGLC